MKSNIKQLETVCEESFGTPLTEGELFDISNRLDRLSKIAYAQMTRAQEDSTTVKKDSKIKTLTQSIKY